MKLQATPLPKAEPVPRPKAEPSPIQAAPETVPAPTKAAKPPKPVDLVADLKKTEERRERKLELKYKTEHEAELKREEAAAKADKVAHVDAGGHCPRGRPRRLDREQGRRRRGQGAHARGGGTEPELWFSLIRPAHHGENQAPVEGVSSSLVARVEFSISADGSVVHVRLIKSSGNSELDESVISACGEDLRHPPPPGTAGTRTCSSISTSTRMRPNRSPAETPIPACPAKNLLLCLVALSIVAGAHAQAAGARCRPTWIPRSLWRQGSGISCSA